MKEENGISAKAHVRRIYTDARDSTLNITLTIAEDEPVDGLLRLRDKWVEVALVLLPQ